MAADQPSAGDDSSIGRQARSGVLWSTTGFVGTRAMTFLSTLVLARLLAPEQFGVVAAVLVFIGFLELISDLGMKAVVVFEQEEGVTRRVHVAFTINLGLSLVLAGLAFALAGPVAGFFHMEEHVWLFRVAALSLLLTGLGNIHDSLLLRSMSFKRRLIPDLTRSMVRATVSIVLAVLGAGAASLVAGWLAGSAAWLVVQWVLSPLRPTLAFDREIARSMVSYGSGAAALELLSAIASRADIAVIGRVLGDRVLGLYTVASRVPELLIENVAWNVSVVAFPAMSRKRVADEHGMGAMMLGVLRWQSLYAMPLGAGMAVLSGPLIVTLFGARWEEAAAVLTPVAVMAALGGIAYPIGDVFKALGRQRVLVAFNLVSVPLFVAAVIVVASEGIEAVAWVRALVRGAFTVALAVAAGRIVGVRMSDLARASWPSLVAAAGVVVGAGAVRLAWPDNAVGPLLAGTAAGLACSLAALRVGAPTTFRDAVGLVRRRPVAA